MLLLWGKKTVMKKLRALAILLLSLMVCCSAFILKTQKNRQIAKILSLMTLEERYYLEAFLHRILVSDDFSYVLFGSKPLAFTDSPTLPTYDYVGSLSLTHLKIRRGFEVFRKYQQYFSSAKIGVQLYVFPEDSSATIVFINKLNCLRTFNEYEKDFKQILGEQITSEEFLHKIVKSDIGNAIKDHEALLGILLGYGRDNAWLFYERKNALARLHEFNLSLKKQDSLRKKLIEMRSLESFSRAVNPCKSCLKKTCVELPHFMANPYSLETQTLRQTYENDRQKIGKILNKKSYLEALLHACL